MIIIFWEKTVLIALSTLSISFSNVFKWNLCPLSISIDSCFPLKSIGFASSRKWAIPGVKGLEHRIGGLEKEDGSGNVSYDPNNHHDMTIKRQEKVDIVANYIPNAKVFGKDSGKLLIVGWGGTYGSIRSGVNKAISEGLSVSHLHLKYINPFPKNLGDILIKYDKVLIPELNMGQLLSIIRSKYLVDAKGYNQIKGKPFTSSEILKEIKNTLKD